MRWGMDDIESLPTVGFTFYLKRDHEQKRFEAAVAAMQGLLAGRRAPLFEGDLDGLTRLSVEASDALLAELAKVKA